MAAFAAAVADLKAGTGRLQLLEGAAGIGKTRLIQHAVSLAGAQGATVLTAHASELEHELGYGVVRQWFERYLAAAAKQERARILDGPAGASALLLDRSARGAAVADDTSFQLLHALFWLTANVAARHPLVIAVDDAHWADGASLRFVEYLARRLDGLGVLVLLAARPDEPGGDRNAFDGIATSANATVLRPRALGGVAVARLLVEAFSCESDDRFLEAALRVTGGNPFLVGELVTAMRRQGMSPTAENADRIEHLGPDAVSRSLLVRARRIPGAVELCRAVAVLGDGAQLRDAASLAGLDERSAQVAASRLARTEILGHGTPLGFVHPIVRSAIYQDLPASERAFLHAAASRLLRQRDAPAERIASHLLHTDAANDRWVAQTLLQAGRHAASTGAAGAAVTILRRALVEPTSVEDRADALFDLGRAEAAIGDPRAADDLLNAFALTLDPRRRAQMAFTVGSVLFLSGRPREAFDIFDAAAVGLEEGDAELDRRLAALVYMACRSSISGRPLVAGRLDRFRGGLVGDTPSDRLLLVNFAADDALTGRANATETGRLAERALGTGALLAHETADSPAVAVAAIALTWCGLLSTARGLLDAALDDARRRGSPLGFCMAAGIRSHVWLKLGNLAEAIADADDALTIETLADYGLRTDIPILISTLVEASLERDEPDLAEQSLARAPVGPLVEETTGYSLLLAARGRLHLVRGQPQRALDDLLVCGERMRRWGAPNPAPIPWRSRAAHALIALNRRQEAASLAAEELDLARRFDAPAPIAIALRAAAASTSGAGEAVHLLRASVEAAAGSEARLEHAHSLVALGAALREAGFPTDARPPLREGLDLASRTGARALATRARRELREAGARPRREQITGVGSLTPSELRVARMAAAGHSNRQIAQDLFLTEHTIEVHLSRGYRKLGITARRDLPTALAP